MSIRALQIMLMSLLAAVLGGCATMIPQTVNEGPATRAFEEVPGIMERWVREQNASVGVDQAGAPFPGWGAAEVVRSSANGAAIRLVRKWSMATRTEYRKNIDEAFISAAPSGYATKVTVVVLTRPAIGDAPKGSGKRDRAKGNQVLRRALGLLSERN